MSHVFLLGCTILTPLYVSRGLNAYQLFTPYRRVEHNIVYGLLTFDFQVSTPTRVFD